MATSSGLDAAEAAVLLSLPRFDARKAIKVGLFALLLQRILRLEVEERRGFLRTRKIVRLYAAADPPPLSPAAQSLIAVVGVAGGTLPEIVNRATRQYGRTLVGFVQDCIGPALVRRGLAQERRIRLLGLWPVLRFYPTPAGEAERRRLEAAMSEARAIPRLLDREPAQAAALAAATGVAIVLVDELKPHYRRLSEALRPPDGNDPSGTIDFTSGSGGGEHHPWGRQSEHCFDFAEFDFNMFDSFDADFAAFDAGFDAAADGGGDGGGGDGGGSGC